MALLNQITKRPVEEEEIITRLKNMRDYVEAVGSLINEMEEKVWEQTENGSRRYDNITMNALHQYNRALQERLRRVENAVSVFPTLNCEPL